MANTPHDTESHGVTYQDKAWDLGCFNKRIGARWDDDGSTHQNVSYDPFWTSNLFLNSTVRNGSHFDQSKIKLSINNLFDNHNVVSITPAITVSNSLILFTPNPSDTIELLPWRARKQTAAPSGGGRLLFPVDYRGAPRSECREA